MARILEFEDEELHAIEERIYFLRHTLGAAPNGLVRDEMLAMMAEIEVGLKRADAKAQDSATLEQVYSAMTAQQRRIEHRAAARLIKAGIDPKIAKWDPDEDFPGETPAEDDLFGGPISSGSPSSTEPAEDDGLKAVATAALCRHCGKEV